MRVELIYEKTCPNIQAARNLILDAFKELKTSASWHEWEISDDACPDYAHGYGSPTILIDGEDINNMATEGHDFCCRVYKVNDGGHSGVPAPGDLISAMRKTDGKPEIVVPVTHPVSLRARCITLIPVISVALVPKLFCPACWPVYAGLLGAMGIGFVNYTPWLLPLTLVFVVIALASLLWRADQRRGYAPFVAGLVSAIALLIGKFNLDSDYVMYAGLAGLVAASLWNTWPLILMRSAPACQACASK